MVRLVLGVVVAFFVSSCATSGSRPKSEFPKREALQRWAEAPPPAEVLPKSQEIPLWELKGSFPTEVALRDALGNDPWTRELKAAIAASSTKPMATEDMACVARELGRFQLESGGSADPAIIGFIAEQCGSLTLAISSNYLYGEVSPAISDEELFSRWRQSTREMFEGALDAEGKNRTIGAWAGRSGKNAVVVVVSGHRRVRLDPVSLHPPVGGAIHLKGTLLVPAESLEALVNRGAFGWAACELDPAVALPDFSLRCEPDPADPSVLIEFSAAEPGRILAELIGKLRFSPGGVIDPVYRRSSLLLTSASTTTTPRDEFLALLNQIRSEAAIPPVELSQMQSVTAERLAPHYFAALGQEEAKSVVDELALGIMAGWDVDGLVQRAGFGSRSTGTTSVASLLATFVESPFGRRMLLSSEVHQVAVGMILSQEPAAIGAMVGTYSIFDQVEQGELIDQVLDVLGAQRKERGKGYPYWLNELGDASVRAVQRIEAGEASPRSAMDSLLSRSAHILDRRVRGFLLEVGSLDQLKFHEELLDFERFGIVVSVARYRPEGEPWGRYVVLIVAAGRDV